MDHHHYKLLVFAGLTGTPEGRQLLINASSVVKNLCLLLNDQQKSIATDASLALVNLSADEDIAPYLFADTSGVVEIMLSIISNPEHELADPACMVLSNLTRKPKGSEAVLGKLLPEMNKYIDIFCKDKFNKKGARLHYLAAVISNLSQLKAMREYIKLSKPPAAINLHHFLYLYTGTSWMSPIAVFKNLFLSQITKTLSLEEEE